VVVAIGRPVADGLVLWADSGEVVPVHRGDQDPISAAAEVLEEADQAIRGKKYGNAEYKSYQTSSRSAFA
jgi:hypothetical protein